MEINEEVDNELLRYFTKFLLLLVSQIKKMLLICIIKDSQRAVGEGEAVDSLVTKVCTVIYICGLWVVTKRTRLWI